jgi:hypothetical protein
MMLEAVRILLAVLELQGVDRQRFLADFIAAACVEQRIEARAGADAHVVVALRADMQVRLEVVAVEHRFAGWALDPQAFRHGLAIGGIGALDSWGQQFFQPTHVLSFAAILNGA